MIDIDLGFETEVSHLSQPLAVGFVHKRLFAGGKAFLGGKGLFGAAGAFLGAGKAPALPPGLVTTPGIPGGPGLTAPGVPGGGHAVRHRRVWPYLHWHRPVSGL